MLFGSLAAMQGMSMHTAISILMQVYKHAEKFDEAEHEADE